MVELLERVAQSWPERPSVVLRLAAVAHRLEEGLDERLAEAPARRERASAGERVGGEQVDALGRGGRRRRAASGAQSA